MSTETEAKVVVVSGDFTLDWNLARSRGSEARSGVWEPEVCSRLRWQWNTSIRGRRLPPAASG